MDFEKIVNPIVKDIPPSGIRKFFDFFIIIPTPIPIFSICSPFVYFASYILTNKV